ncbi:hypothetical protein EDB84DRAFT_1564992 [Lactarius hengduanensis]|nr:hypothetical protein EDB84DRAFT_1564992 [Lactarius hengduanensis]
MSTTEDSDSTGEGGARTEEVPTPYPPSPVEAEYCFYGLYSNPRLIARSSIDTWIEPRGAEAYLTPKETQRQQTPPLRDRIAGHRMLTTLGHAVGDSDGRLELEGSKGLTGRGREPEDAATCWLRGRERGGEALLHEQQHAVQLGRPGAGHEDALFQPPPPFRLPPQDLKGLNTGARDAPWPRNTAFHIRIVQGLTNTIQDVGKW